VSIKKRLPLPKNVVLLSLMEATELASEQVKPSGSPRAASLSSRNAAEHRPATTVLPMNSMVDVEDDEEEKIKVSTSIAVSAAGTYAVAHKEGLQLHPTRPTDSNSRALADFSNSSGHDEDVDTIVQSLDRHKGKTPSPTKVRSPKSSADNFESGLSLSYGDRVQVVALEGGWAKLARGYGYVRVDKNQLVKGTSVCSGRCSLRAGYYLPNNLLTPLFVLTILLTYSWQRSGSSLQIGSHASRALAAAKRASSRAISSRQPVYTSNERPGNVASQRRRPDCHPGRHLFVPSYVYNLAGKEGRLALRPRSVKGRFVERGQAPPAS
jgi:hypothetical protein